MVDMMKKTDAALTKALSEHDYAVVPGFYGQLNDESGRIKAFSRGGSDVTGSIVAKCACADLYENWTDVSRIPYCGSTYCQGS